MASEVALNRDRSAKKEPGVDSVRLVLSQRAGFDDRGR